MYRIITVAAFAAFATYTSPTQAQNTLPAERTDGTKRGPQTLLEAIAGPRAGQDEQSRDEGRVEPDRPHFPEATTTVGKGRAVLESGYTFSSKGRSFAGHSFPEALLRVGMLTDWFEFRVGQNGIAQRQTEAGVTTSTSGLQDLYLGFKVALMEQHGALPAITVIPQMTVPTGSAAVTAGRVMPGVNLDLSWEVIKDVFSIEVLVANNMVRDGLFNARHELATGLTGTFNLTKNLEAFIEWDAFYPSSGIGPSGSRQYAVGGFVYYFTPNVAVDVRAGIGLNERADDFLSGLGFAVRF